MAATTGNQGGLPRGRVLVLVAIAIAAAAVVVVLALIATGGDASKPSAAKAQTPSATTKPLAGRPPLVAEFPTGVSTDAAERLAWAKGNAISVPNAWSALLLAAAEDAAGDRAAARAALDGVTTPQADAARALLAYDPKAPQASVEALAQLDAAHRHDAFIAFAYGSALLWSGQRAKGDDVLAALRDAAPESFLGTAADDLMHPSSPPGYPPFISSKPVPEKPVDDLVAAAKAHPNDARAQIDAGAALLAHGRRAEAADAFDNALFVDPGSVEAKIGKIMATYSKDHPERSFGQMGPLVRDNPANPAPRLHLALMLIWIRSIDTARAELRQVAAADPNGTYGWVAKQFLASL